MDITKQLDEIKDLYRWADNAYQKAYLPSVEEATYLQTMATLQLAAATVKQNEILREIAQRLGNIPE